jgi:hypothetical protein
MSTDKTDRLYLLSIMSAYFLQKPIKMVVFRWNVTKGTIFVGYAVAQLVEELLHKLKSRGLDSRLGVLIELIILPSL